MMSGNNESFEMDPELAKILVTEGATLVILNFPRSNEFGIDMKSWTTDKNFMGIKMIPPGVHICYYNLRNKHGDCSPRISFFHTFKKGEVLVKKWDADLEEINSNGVTPEDVSKIRSNLMNIDKNLGPYPFDTWNIWRSLSNKITEPVLERVNPECGVIRSALELISKDPAIVAEKITEYQSSDQEPDESDLSSERKVSVLIEPSKIASSSKKVHFEEVCKLIRHKSNDDSLLPSLKPRHGTEPRFTEIPDICYPKGSTPADITLHSLDLSYTLDSVISSMNTRDELLGELQISFLCFLIGSSFESLDAWRRIVWLMCRCFKAMESHRNLYFDFLTTLDAHLDHIPEDFLVDIVQSENVIYMSLRELFRGLMMEQSDKRLLNGAMKLQTKFTDKFGWDFSDLDQDDEEDAPVVVELS